MYKDMGPIGWPGYKINEYGYIISPDGREILGNANGCVKLPGGSFWSIPKLVAKMFLGEKPGYNYIRYKDGDRWNWHVDNLEWCVTPQKAGKRTARIIQMIQDGKSVDEICRALDVYPYTVRAVARRREKELQARLEVERRLKDKLEAERAAKEKLKAEGTLQEE